MTRKMRFFFCWLFLFWGTTVMAQHKVTYKLYMRSDVGTITLWDGVVTRIFGFAPMLSASPSIPGPTLYVNEGDTLAIHAYSLSQSDHHSVHMHGLDADTQNDGDPATSFELMHGQDTTYRVVCSHAGTYLYHCHVADVVHVQMGMYGLIIVRPADGGRSAWTGGPAYDRSFHWLMSELDRSWHDTIPVHDTINMTVNIPPYHPDYFLVNGRSHQQLDEDSTRIVAAAGERVYLRLANIGFYDNRVIFPAAMHARVIDSDGRPLPAGVSGDTVDVSPGERYGVMLTPETEMQDSIAVQYLNMNTGLVEDTEHVPCVISGWAGDNTLPERADVKVYPNPFTQWVQLEAELSPSVPVKVTISDLQGRNVSSLFSWSIQAKGIQLSSQLASPGEYFVHLEQEGLSIRASIVRTP